MEKKELKTENRYRCIPNFYMIAPAFLLGRKLEVMSSFIIGMLKLYLRLPKKAKMYMVKYRFRMI